jgi:hypothetical protein
MSEFKPFNLTPKSSREFACFRAAIVNDVPTGEVSGRRCEIPVALPHLHEGTAAAKTNGSPRISLRREGDRITHIQVECGCGQVIELECSY